MAKGSPMQLYLCLLSDAVMFCIRKSFRSEIRQVLFNPSRIRCYNVKSDKLAYTLYLFLLFFIFLEMMVHSVTHWCWTGLNDLASRHHWVWAGTGETLIASNWRAGEPNGVTNQCVWVYHDDGSWDDAPCTSAVPSVCEY